MNRMDVLTVSDLNDTPTIDDTFVYKGSEIHFRSLGQGSPLIFVHGFGASMDTWRLLVKDLRDEFHLVFLDLKGHGYSARPRDSRYSIEDHAGAVLGLMEHLELKSAVLVGHSLGSGVALVAALNELAKPTRLVSKLVLLAGSAHPEQLHFFGRQLHLFGGWLGAPVIAWLMTKLTPTRFITRMALRHAFYDHAKVTDSLIELYAKYQRIPGTFYALMRTVRNFIAADFEFVRRSLGQIQIPVLNILGEHDRIVPRSTAEALRKLLPQCSLEIIDGVGHVPQEECPEAVVQLIRKFVRTPVADLYNRRSTQW
jgi:pimeloyl-ACP methyl ester carboxylesterase